MSFNKLVAAVIKQVPLLNKGVYSFSKRYIDVYRDYSYNFSRNGEAAIVRKLADILPPQAVVFDVGANKGAWAQAVRESLPQAQIHCFELSPRTFRNLEQRLGSAPGVTLNNIGLSNKDDIVRFRDYGENHGGNTLIHDPSYVHRGPVEMIEGRVVRGADYCRAHRITAIDFLKVDVEGWEYFVLQGFEELLRDGKIGMVQFEYGYANADVHSLMKDFYQLFESYGMRIGRLTPRGVLFTPFSHDLNDFKSGPNFVACLPALETALSRF